MLSQILLFHFDQAESLLNDYRRLMEDKRAKTLRALSSFIDKQRALLTRTQADIGRLNELRSKAIAEPEEFAENIEDELNDDAFKLSLLQDAAEGPPEGIEWSLFAKHDPTPLQTLVTKSAQPPSLPSPSVSDFQKRIRDAKANMLDPVFSAWNLSFDPVMETAEEEEKDPTPVDPAALKKTKEREKIKELKKHKITPSGLTFTPSGPRNRGPGGVFIRRDLVDESMDVDISADIEGIRKDTETSALHSVTASVPCSPSPSLTQPPLASPLSLEKPPRPRNSTSKVAYENRKSFGIRIMSPPGPPALSISTRQRRRSSRAVSSCTDDLDMDSHFPPTPDSLPPPEARPAVEHEADVLPEEDEVDAPQQVLGKRVRPKSETYKQAWSTSEQQLLEVLLEQIPEGEKNRWKKISKAMNGRRTPRQVASRVQKYFEKLKRFGIN
ncbi:hypothetical protein D9757_012055 [Collybiopsis confluens]|uniref:Uncharacterized protein n=1 Tax=Collybiopsis confluens TaxID=2823264 RepID=A0A8H5D2D8_9AGAR|nr:hypothetical protein D9757_012055 [Collybiopsis confluens]